MTGAQVCTDCRKKKPGRYTRLKGSSGRGHEKGMTVPNWHCWSCLPAGQGAGETEETTAPIKPGATAVVVSPQVVKAKEEGATIIGPLQAEVVEMRVDDAESYLAADQILGRIQTARKTWGARMERIIRPIRQGLDEIYALSRDVDKPLAAMEALVKGRMTDYKLEEARQLAVIKRAQELETARLEQELAAKLEKEQNARTKQMRERLAEARLKVQEKLEVAQAEEAPAPIMGSHSSTRSVKKWRVTDKEKLLKGVIAGTIPESIATWDERQINSYFRAEPDRVATWDGIEVYDDVQIVGR